MDYQNLKIGMSELFYTFTLSSLNLIFINYKKDYSNMIKITVQSGMKSTSLNIQLWVVKK